MLGLTYEGMEAAVYCWGAIDCVPVGKGRLSPNCGCGISLRSCGPDVVLSLSGADGGDGWVL